MPHEPVLAMLNQSRVYSELTPNVCETGSKYTLKESQYGKSITKYEWIINEWIFYCLLCIRLRPNIMMTKMTV